MKRYSVMLIFLLGTASVGWTFNFVALQPKYDILLMMNTHEDSAPSPVYHTLGMAAHFSFNETFFMAPALDFFWSEYIYQDNRALPAEIEANNASGTLGIILSSPFYASFPLTESLQYLAGLSPSFVFRLPLVAYGNDPGLGINLYYLAGFRIFYPDITTGISWDVYEKVSFRLQVRTLLPLFRLWDGEGLSFNDQMFIGGELGLLFAF